MHVRVQVSTVNLWDFEISETKWEPPDDYVSLAEQEEQITTDDPLDNSEKVINSFL